MLRHKNFVIRYNFKTQPNDDERVNEREIGETHKKIKRGGRGEAEEKRRKKGKRRNLADIRIMRAVYDAECKMGRRA